MDFFSFHFLIFIALLILIYGAGPVRAHRRAVLSLANVVFLLTFLQGVSDGVALAAFVLVSYGMLLALQRWRWRWVPGVAILLVVLALLVLKRYDFLYGWLPGGLLGHSLTLIGISYMSFKLIHVMVDLRQGQLAPLDFPCYANYQLGFFSLVAGPIQRYNDFQRFWVQAHETDADQQEGLRAWNRVLTGLLKMGVLAQGAFYVFAVTREAIPSSPSPALASATFLAMFYAYPAYIYFNFSGYCDIVIGAARMLGMKHQENFDHPYVARDMMDFWNRWHISLTFWIRDYVFMSSYKLVAERWPGSAKAVGYLLLLVALLLAGIWHGPTLNFIAFGLVHGIGVAVAQIYADTLRAGLGREGMRAYLANPWFRALAIGVTLHYVCFSFLFFTPDLRETLNLLQIVWARIF